MRCWPRIGIRAIALLASATAVGCSSSTGGQPMMCSGPDVVASEKNDYAFSSTITLPPVTVAQMSNLTFDWSGLTHDFEGHTLDPSKDLGMAIVMFWSLPLADFETQLNADALFTSDLILSPPLSLELAAGDTSAHALRFHDQHHAGDAGDDQPVLRRDAVHARQLFIHRRRADRNRPGPATPDAAVVQPGRRRRPTRR